MRHSLLLHIVLATLLLTAHATASAPPEVDHSAFDDLLSTYVDSDGMVDYEGIQQAHAEVLKPYLETLANAQVDGLSPDEELAFWINAYNALTIDLIVRHYPVEDIFETYEDNPFEKTVGVVAGNEVSLDELEHDFIDARFDDPRFHFALVCAAMSCPPLRQEAYTGDRLDQQLEEQTRQFIRDESHNQIEGQHATIHLSTIFDWFEDDFGGSPEGVQQYLATFFDGETRARLEAAAFAVEYNTYDWTLNDQAIATAGR